MDDPRRLRACVGRARRLIRRRRCQAAVDLLGAVLADGKPRREDPDLVFAALLYVTAARRLPEDAVDAEVLFGCARYALTVSRWLPDHPHLAEWSTAAFVGVCRRQHRPAAVVALAQTPWRQAQACEAVRAWREGALASHAYGNCAFASRMIERALRSHARNPVEGVNPATLLLSAAVIAAGCGDVAGAVTVLTGNAGMLAGTGREDLASAARWLTAAEQRHPVVCEFRSSAVGEDAAVAAARRQFWFSTLIRITGTSPGRAVRGRRGATEPGS